MTESPNTPAFQLADYLDPSMICMSLKSASKHDVIEELLQIADSNGALDDLDSARKAVMEREEGMSTGMQHGIALPHGKTDTVKKIVCAVGLKADGIDFESIDGELSRVFVLMLSPEGATDQHLKFMSTIGRVLNGTGTERMLACQSAEDVMALLSAPPPEPNGHQGGKRRGSA